PGLSAVIRRTAIEPSTDYSVRAYKEKDRIVLKRLSSGQTVMTMTAKDLENLDDDSKKYISAKERSMTSLFQEWSVIYPTRNDGDQAFKDNKATRLSNLAKEMCRDLDGILAHLGTLGFELQDHYAAVRSICRESNGNQN